ncbi:MAG: hypothetical protein ABL908_21935, partial [Hyphomicrobium sp.]
WLTEPGPHFNSEPPGQHRPVKDRPLSYKMSREKSSGLGVDMADRPTEQDVLLAILALDAYSRGANPQLCYSADEADVLAETIATATWLQSSDDLETAGKLAGAAAVGFGASQYKLAGKTVISYRGTSFDGVAGPSAKDVLHGLTLGVDYSGADQAQLAKEFYTIVSGQQVYGGTPPDNLILTGHSLGGGLAAFVASLTGAQASIYNNIPFGSGVVAEILTQNSEQVLSDVASRRLHLGRKVVGRMTRPSATRPRRGLVGPTCPTARHTARSVARGYPCRPRRPESRVSPSVGHVSADSRADAGPEADLQRQTHWSSKRYQQRQFYPVWQTPSRHVSSPP